MKKARNHPTLQEAFDLFAVQQNALLPDDEALSTITFSDAFQQRMHRLFRRQQYGFYVFFGTVGRRIASIAVTLLIAATAATVSIPAWRDTARDFFLRAYRIATHVCFAEDKTIYSETRIVEPNRPTYIPEGYTVTEEERVTLSYYIAYTHDSGAHFYLLQSMNTADIYVNTEGTYFTDITVNGRPGITYHNLGYTSILFADDKYAYHISGTCSFETLMQIAESIELF